MNVPALIDVGPLSVLLPLTVRVPLSESVREPEPAITPLRVILCDPPMMKLAEVVAFIAPAKLAAVELLLMIVPAKLFRFTLEPIVWPSRSSMAPEASADAARTAPQRPGTPWN